MAAAESMVAARSALDELYRSHSAEVYRYAYAVLGNHSDAEDVTQTTFVNALRALERGERPRKPSNWLITIAHNIVRQRFRQQQARPAEVELDRDVPQEPSDDSGPSLEELVRALQRIPQSQREALVMRELEDRSYNEISQILGLSTSALETLIFRARRSLADELANAATCDRVELGLSRQLDGRLSRKERKRLDDHVAECPSCRRLQATQGRQRRAFKGLALLPLPLSLTFFKGAPSASAALGLPTIGAAGTAAVVGGGAAATAGGGITFGGLALGGVAVKAAAVVAAASVAGGVGYIGTQEVQSHRNPVKKTPVTAVSPAAAKPRPTSAGGAQRQAATTAKGKALAKGSARATAPTGSSRGAAAPGRAKQTEARPVKQASRPVKQASRTAKPTSRPVKGAGNTAPAAKPAIPSPAPTSPKARAAAVVARGGSSNLAKPKDAPATKRATAPLAVSRAAIDPAGSANGNGNKP